MKFLKTTGLEFYKLLGLRGPSDLLDSLLGIRPYTWPELKLQAIATAIIAFLSQWVWAPPYALAILLALDVGNAVYGTLIATRIKRLPFSWNELHRTFGKMLATVFVLALLRGAILAYPYYAPLAHVLFAWLFSRKMAKLTAKMAALKVQETGLPNLFKSMVQMVLKSTYGAAIVDAAQDRPTPAIPPGQPEASAPTAAMPKAIADAIASLATPTPPPDATNQ